MDRGTMSELPAVKRLIVGDTTFNSPLTPTYHLYNSNEEYKSIITYFNWPYWPMKCIKVKMSLMGFVFL